MTREEFIRRELDEHDRDVRWGRWAIAACVIAVLSFVIYADVYAATKHTVTYSESLYKSTSKVQDIYGTSEADAHQKCKAEQAAQTVAATYRCQTAVTTDVVTIVPDPPVVVGPVLQFTATYGTAYKLLQGATVSGKVNVALSDCSIAGDWTFYLDGVQANVESGCPYEFLGDGTMWDSTTVANGSHTISAKGSSTITATFTVSNAVPVPPTPLPGGSATLSWVAPTQNTDGSTLTNLAGYRLYYGTSIGSLTQTVTIAGPSVTAYVLQGLAPGTYYFAVTAYTSANIESPLSVVVSKTL